MGYEFDTSLAGSSLKGSLIFSTSLLVVLSMSKFIVSMEKSPDDWRCW